jgi:excinuclease ABC subunit C
VSDPASYRPKPGEIPTNPGVYRFSDPEGRVIYVGKAINLRSRLNSYFADVSGLHFRTQTMVRTAAKVEWTIVRNELEALQLEYTWIKQFQPRFNIKYRDDKSYPWAAVTWADEFPRVFVGRGAKRKGVRYFGPYAQAWAIRQTIDSMLSVFPMRSCSDGTFRNAQRSGRPCLLGHIGKCAAPCAGRVNAAEHRELAEAMCKFLAGRTAGLIKELQAAMEQASAAQEYEQAAMFRDRLAALESVAEKNAVVLPDGSDADVIALAADPLEVAVAIFFVRSGRVRGERSWVADRSDDTDESGLLESFLLQVYSDAGLPGADDDVPAEILLPALPESADTLMELLGELRGSKVAIRVPQRGEKRALVETVAQNAAQALAVHKSRRASDLSTRNRALEEIQQALGLASAPLRIECYDISHLQGSEVVASMVVFEDGLARKSDYRRFVLKHQESNDVAAMREVLTRRFTRLLADDADQPGQASQVGSADPAAESAQPPGGESGPLLIDPTTGAPRRFAYRPGLVVVDGGAPQVAAGQQALSALGLGDIPLCGLAKRLEEVWLPGEDFPVILPRNSEGLYLLQRIRDEAHRFAITHHRGRRSKSMLESVLDEVPNLGEVRRKALMKQFSSLKKLRAADAEQLAAVPGIGPKVAEAIVSALARSQPAPAINMETGELIE